MLFSRLSFAKFPPLAFYLIIFFLAVLSICFVYAAYHDYKSQPGSRLNKIVKSIIVGLLTMFVVLSGQIAAGLYRAKAKREINNGLYSLLGIPTTSPGLNNYNHGTKTPPPFTFTYKDEKLKFQIAVTSTVLPPTYYLKDSGSGQAGNVEFQLEKGGKLFINAFVSDQKMEKYYDFFKPNFDEAMKRKGFSKQKINNMNVYYGTEKSVIAGPTFEVKVMTKGPTFSYFIEFFSVSSTSSPEVINSLKTFVAY